MHDMTIPDTVELLESWIIHEATLTETPQPSPDVQTSKNTPPHVVLCPECYGVLEASQRAKNARIIVFCSEGHHWLATVYQEQQRIELQRVTPESTL